MDVLHVVYADFILHLLFLAVVLFLFLLLLLFLLLIKRTTTNTFFVWNFCIIFPINQFVSFLFARPLNQLVCLSFRPFVWMSGRSVYSIVLLLLAVWSMNVGWFVGRLVKVVVLSVRSTWVFHWVLFVSLGIYYIRQNSQFTERDDDNFNNSKYLVYSIEPDRIFVQHRKHKIIHYSSGCCCYFCWIIVHLLLLFDSQDHSLTHSFAHYYYF